jgi:hypothetical protein
MAVKMDKSLLGYRFSAYLAVALGGAGCTNIDGVPPTGTIGELGNGRFFYECDGASDPLCDVPVEDLTIPEGVAVGSRFGASYTAELFTTKVRVLSAAPALLDNVDSFGSIFEAHKPGVSALLAQQGDSFIDFVHVRLAEVDDIRIDSLDPVDEQIADIDLALGAVRLLRAVPTDEDGIMLAGALACDWSVEDESIARFITDSNDNQAALEGLSVGATTATIKMGALEVSIPVEVADGGIGGGGAGGSGQGGSGGMGGTGGTQ